MRLRRKPWARPELAACGFFIDEPKEQKGKWAETFNNGNPIYLELGCGKGNFIAQIATDKPNINFIAVDIKSEVLGLAKRTCEAAYKQKNLNPNDNLRMLAYDIERIDDVISDEDKVDRIYINFCNPWPKPKHKKHRLTHTRQLIKYSKFLKDDGKIYFKTDDDELFSESLEYFSEAGYEIIYKTYDLHASGVTENYVTEHEEMFSREGIKIKFLIAEKAECPSSEENKEK